MIKKRNTIYLIDFLSEGHHSTYISMISETFLKMGNNIVIIYPDTNFLESEIKKWKKEIDQEIYINTPVSEYKNQSLRYKVLNNWRRSIQSIKKARKKSGLRPDLVFFCWLDNMRFHRDHRLIIKGFIKFLEIKFTYNWSGIYFHPVQYSENAKEEIGSWNFDRIFQLKKCIGVCMLDEFVIEKTERNIKKTVIHFPDFSSCDIAPESSIYYQLKMFSKDGFLIGSIGALGERKGLIPLMNLAIENSDGSLKFAFIGKIQKDQFSPDNLKRFLDFVEKKPENCFFYLDKVDTEGEFNKIISAFDAIYAAYLSFPSTSNMVFKACLLNKPLIVNKGYWMEKVVRKNNLGVVIDLDNSNFIANIILDLKANIDSGVFNPNYDLYLSENHPEKIEEKLKLLLNLI
ncbi:MAG: hypothetical protein A2W91_12265 [Bacteroidetes bacterium GWF2_38_335]|nr:MAG: hypothetical protein A2W91_12265 [Bacteroidetes bacterium GWF2_38_335]OFY76945.1 MAG: hypothetical protein A2281_00380 [Bacteroidetes bacterium RIFOXYA12_FULL_38_20]HBS86797.1 hypothetical protein [Bacteroidales bacterium]